MKNKDLIQLLALYVAALAGLALMTCMSGCTTTAPDAADPTHVVTWTSPIACTAITNHPCPYLTSTTLLSFNALGNATVDGTRQAENRLALTWWGFEVGDASALEEIAHYTFDGDIELASEGDGAGLRQAAVLHCTPSGYVGDVSWLLDVVAGTTTFHVVIDRVDTLEVGQ